MKMTTKPTLHRQTRIYGACAIIVGLLILAYFLYKPEPHDLIHDHSIPAEVWTHLDERLPASTCKMYDGSAPTDMPDTLYNSSRIPNDNLK